MVIAQPSWKRNEGACEAFSQCLKFWVVIHLFINPPSPLSPNSWGSGRIPIHSTIHSFSHPFIRPSIHLSIHSTIRHERNGRVSISSFTHPFAHPAHRTQLVLNNMVLNMHGFCQNHPGSVHDVSSGRREPISLRTSVSPPLLSLRNGGGDLSLVHVDYGLGDVK